MRSTIAHCRTGQHQNVDSKRAQIKLLSFQCVVTDAKARIGIAIARLMTFAIVIAPSLFASTSCPFVDSANRSEAKTYFRATMTTTIKITAIETPTGANTPLLSANAEPDEFNPSLLFFPLCRSMWTTIRTQSSENRCLDGGGEGAAVAGLCMLLFAIQFVALDLFILTLLPFIWLAWLITKHCKKRSSTTTTDTIDQTPTKK